MRQVEESTAWRKIAEDIFERKGMFLCSKVADAPVSETTRVSMRSKLETALGGRLFAYNGEETDEEAQQGRVMAALLFAAMSE